MRFVTETIPLRFSDILSPPQAADPPGEILRASGNHDDLAWFTSGRTAIQWALRDAGIGSEDEVILPGYSCHAVDRVVSNVAKPVYADITTSLDLDIGHVQEVITKNSAAIMPTHLYGISSNVQEVAAVAREHDLIVIEDAAQATANLLESSSVGTQADYTVLSTRYFKEVTAYTGGILLGSDLSTGDAVSEQRLKRARLACVWLANVALSLLPGKVYEPLRSNHLDPRARSVSASVDRAEPVSSAPWTKAILGYQLERLQSRVRARRRNAAIYDEMLDERLESPAPSDSSTYFRYPILVPDGARDELSRVARRRGIGVSTMYSYCIGPEEDCPTAARMSRDMLNLPVHSGLSSADIEEVARLLNDALDEIS